MRRIATTLVVAGIIVSQAAYAQVTLNFVNADIDQVAKAIGAATGKTIIVDPRVKGQLNLVAERPVPEEQALKTLQSALFLLCCCGIDSARASIAQALR